jgi:hypothetical protein
LEIHIKIFSSETTGPIATKLWWNDPWVAPLPKLCPVIPTLSKWFQTRRFLWEFPIGSYVKLSSAVAAILVKVLKCRTQFWKRTTQAPPILPSLVPIGPVVSEENIKIQKVNDGRTDDGRSDDGRPVVANFVSYFQFLEQAK